jgi:plastocyanin
MICDLSHYYEFKIRHKMILKTAIMVASGVTLVVTSMAVGGVVIIGQILESDPNIRNEIRKWLEGGIVEDSGRNLQEERSSSASPLSTMEDETVISIVGNSGSNSYNPNLIEIKVGDTLTWRNDDSSPHTVTFSSSSSDINNITIFDSGVLMRGETFSFTFDMEGEYRYFCTLHPNMVGTVVVIAA